MVHKAMGLIEAIANFYGVTSIEILGKSRKSYIVDARRIAAYLLKKKLKLSYSLVGKILNRDHSTIMYFVNSTEDKMVNNFLLSYGEKTAELLGSPAYKESSVPSSKSKWNKIFQLRGVKCEVCNFDDVIEVHHLVSKKAGGSDEVNNLIILCPNHHSLLHHGLLKFNPEKFSFLNLPNDLSTSYQKITEKT